MPSYYPDTYYYNSYRYDDGFYEVSYPPSASGHSDRPLVQNKKVRTLSKTPVRTKPGPDPTEAVRKLERGVRKVCRKASETVVEVCTKIYEKSCATVAIAVDKHRSIKMKKNPSHLTFNSGKYRDKKIGNPQAMYFY